MKIKYTIVGPCDLLQVDFQVDYLGPTLSKVSFALIFTKWKPNSFI